MSQDDQNRESRKPSQREPWIVRAIVWCFTFGFYGIAISFALYALAALFMYIYFEFEW